MRITLSFKSDDFSLAARKDGWPQEACKTAWLESKIPLTFSRSSRGTISTEVDIHEAAKTAALIEQLLQE